VFSDAVHDIAFIGLVHPHIAMTRLRRRGKVSDAVWALYSKKLDAAGGSVPPLPEDDASVDALLDAPAHETKSPDAEAASKKARAHSSEPTSGFSV
jgi:hypothetical protein